MKLNTGVLIIFFAAAFFLPGCKKNNTTNALLVLNIHNIFAQDSITLGATYHTSLGRNISFSRINYYISDLQLTGTDNSVQPVSGTLLVNPQTQQYNVGTVSPGSFKSISFTAGVDSALNNTDPLSYTGNNPLGTQNPSMHFSTDSLGYIFMAVEGLFDSSAAGNGTPNKPFSYHIGATTLSKTIYMPDHSAAPYNAAFTAAAGQLLVIGIESDLSVLLNNIDVKSNPITNTSDYPAVADSLASHVPAMFVYQK